MDVETAIRGRRSIRKYGLKEVPETAIAQILDSGNWAPSAGNLQSRKFYVLSRKSQLKEKIAQILSRPEAALACSHLIVVCADKKIMDKFGDRGLNLYRFLDCGAAVQNMLLTAYSLGLGSLWVGTFDPNKAAQLLGLPSNLEPVTIVLVGVPDETPAPKPRKNWEEETVIA